MSYAALFNSPLGPIELRSDDGLTLSALRFVPASGAADSLPVFDEAREWLRRYFRGQNPGPAPALDPSGTEFQRRVWSELRRVPYASRVTYGQLARRVGCPSPQAVGRAVGANPILLLIPCHRVVAANGLGGFAAGLQRKIWLLNHEAK